MSACTSSGTGTNSHFWLAGELELLLDAVWGRKQDAVGSNVVDVVVLARRKKLGARAGALATVRGSGYRLLA